MKLWQPAGEFAMIKHFLTIQHMVFIKRTYIQLLRTDIQLQHKVAGLFKYVRHFK